MECFDFIRIKNITAITTITIHITPKTTGITGKELPPEGGDGGGQILLQFDLS